MRFSIIVPVYNVEKYIKKCLDSLINQTFSDFQIVVVDDQSPDNSMEIVESFANQYPEKFKIIHQENKGLGGARNTGVSAAEGDYLLFVDSDDYLQKNSLEILHNHLNEYPCDIVEFNYLEVSEDGKPLRKVSLCDSQEVCVSPPEKAKLFLEPPIACNKAYRREFYTKCDVRFPEKTLYEDFVTRILIAKAENILRITDYLYNYVQRAGSIMHNNVSPRVLDIIKVAESVYDVFEKENLMKDYFLFLEAGLIASLVHIASDVIDRNKTSPYYKNIVDYAVEKLPDYRENPYISNEIKKKLICLEKGDFAGYRKADKIIKIKLALLQSPLVRRINNLRKHIIK